jgi:hypothetical protein
MSAAHAVAPVGRTHPAVRRRRTSRALLIGGAVLAALGIAAALSLSMKHPNFALVFGLIAGMIGISALVSITALEVSVAFLALYLGLLDGPVKNLSGSQLASAGRDVVIAAVCIGALLRIVAKREQVKLPPLIGWVAAFVGLVLIMAFNPKTAGFLKVVGGYRQNLEWIPFFFFGYVLMRSRKSFRRLFVILGVLTLVNGVIATYQTQIPVSSLAAWGPGYNEKVEGTRNEETGTGIKARKYTSEGVGRVRPPGLGADSGFPGGLGVIALPGILALLATGRPRQRWYAYVMALGALVAIAMGLSRSQLLGGVIVMVSFLIFSLSAGRRVTKPVSALLAMIAIAIPFGIVFVNAVGPGIFSRYESVEPTSVVHTSTTYKEKSLALIPHYIGEDPFGFGLGTAGAAVGFGGNSAHNVLEGHGISAETQYNFVEDELGAPGLILWIALTIEIFVLVVRQLPKVPDIDIRIFLAAVFAAFIAHTLMGIRGAFMGSSSAGPYFWFSLGIAAYWFAGPGRGRPTTPSAEPARVPAGT